MPISISTLNVGSFYNMSFIAPPILTGGLKGAQLSAILDFDTAMSMDNVAQIHENVLPYLPSLNQSPAAYKYLIFRKDGVRSIISTAWIVDNSMVEITSRNASLVVPISNDDDKRRITDILQRAGYSVTSISG